MTPFCDQTATEIAEAVRTGRRTATDQVQAAYAGIRARDGALNCFTSTRRERALAAAERIDLAIRQGREPGVLAGAPFAVKNLFDIEGEITLAGSVIEAGKAAAESNATLVSRLEAAGAILVGALNMDEYAYGFTTENIHYGATRNPHDVTRIAGGSSGGSAAAVAAGLAPISLGTDTNGSIRVPAALCGVYGLKPTFGRLSRHGTKPFVHSLDHVGPFARTVEDLAQVYDVLQGADPLDPTCVERDAEFVSDTLGQPDRPIRTGMLGGYFRDGATPQALAAVEEVASHLRADNAELAGANAARAAAFCLTGAESGALHLDNLRNRPRDYDPAIRDRLIAGALQPAAALAKAQRVRRWFLQEALRLFTRFDVLVAPATPFAATPIGEATTQIGDAHVSVRANLGRYTQPISFIGLPVLTVPVIRGGCMPLGVQLIAAPWGETQLFEVAYALQEKGIVGARLPSSSIDAVEAICP